MIKIYKYTGDLEIHLVGVGNVSPGQIVKTEIEINHPELEEVKSEVKKSTKENKK